MIRVLRDEHEVREAEAWRRARNLAQPSCIEKSWDNGLAAQRILGDLGVEATVLDAGCRSGIMLPWLWKLGLRHLWGCDLRVPWPPMRTAARHGRYRDAARFVAFVAANWRRLRRADVTHTRLPTGAFDAVTSMSVVEHGVPVRAFLEEAHRLLRPAGLLLLSTDYWPDATDTRGLRRYNDAGDVVFDRAGIAALLETAREIGFRVDAGEPPPVQAAVIHDEGLHYTFLYTEMEKV